MAAGDAAMQQKLAWCYENLPASSLELMRQQMLQEQLAASGVQAQPIAQAAAVAAEAAAQAADSADAEASYAAASAEAGAAGLLAPVFLRDWASIHTTACATWSAPSGLSTYQCTMMRDGQGYMGHLYHHVFAIAPEDDWFTTHFSLQCIGGNMAMCVAGGQLHAIQLLAGGSSA